jgi:hypothetical protein
MKGRGIDLAISEKEGADYTTIVSGEVFYVENAPKIFIRPNPYNEDVTFHNFMQHVRSVPGEPKGANIFFVEDVGYQKAAIEEMERAMIPVVPMKPQGDKRPHRQDALFRLAHVQAHLALETISYFRLIPHWKRPRPPGSSRIGQFWIQTNKSVLDTI